MEQDQINILIEKYLNNTASAEEVIQLHEWYREFNNDPLSLPYNDERDEENAKQILFAKISAEILHDKPKPARLKKHLYQLVAIAAAIMIGAFFYVKILGVKNIEKSSSLIVTSTRFGEHKTLTLSDGSKIWLSAGSSVQYPNVFNGKLREITFKGEAYFEIAKDKSHPFIVHVGNTQTKVLGTSFNIRAFNEKKEIAVTLVEGKVSFSDKKNVVTLLPNDRVIYKKDLATMAKSKVADVSALIARKNGEYQYDNVPVDQIVEDLERNFNAHIRLKGNFDHCTFYGRMKQGESLEKFLKKVTAVIGSDLDISKEKHTYTIEGGGCK